MRANWEGLGAGRDGSVDERSERMGAGYVNISGFFPAKRQIFLRNSNTPFRRSTIVYNTSGTAA